MAKHKIEDKEVIIEVCVYEVEAETKEEALDLYVNKLAGTLEPIHTYTKDKFENGEELISVI